MKYCSSCGEIVEFLIPEGDNRYRYVCVSCETVHYQNPNVVAGVIAEHGDRILLCKRAIEPQLGKWTLPAGFLENKETVMAGAAREAHEEARAELDSMRLFCAISIPHISQLYMIYRGTLIDGYAEPGPESQLTALYAESEIPWDELAFPVIIETLKLYYADKSSGAQTIHYGDLIKHEDASITLETF